MVKRAIPSFTKFNYQKDVLIIDIPIPREVCCEVLISNVNELAQMKQNMQHIDLLLTQLRPD
jgi:hypothetical protein